MIKGVTALAGASVRAGLTLGRTVVGAVPKAITDVAGRVLPFGGSDQKEPRDDDRYSVRVEVPVQAAPPNEPAPAEPPAAEAAQAERAPKADAPGPDVEAAIAEVIDPHIDEEEPELVAEVAEPGAEDGPGPDIEITDKRED